VATTSYGMYKVNTIIKNVEITIAIYRQRRERRKKTSEKLLANIYMNKDAIKLKVHMMKRMA
jgi:hypothetical protein